MSGGKGAKDVTWDVTVIGGGIVGSAIARELVRRDHSVCVIEKDSDVSSGASKANSGVVHSAIYNATGSLKAKYCLMGNRMYGEWARELGVEAPFVGKLTVATKDEDLPELEKLMEKGKRNGVEGLRITDEAEARRMEPNVNARWALDIPTAGIVSPYTITIAAAENACRNGARFMLETGVSGIERDGDGFRLRTHRGEVRTRLLVNSAGLYADEVAAMAGVEGHRIYPVKGQYYIIDKAAGHLVTRMIYPVPPKRLNVVGVHITPTTEGNIILGPTADYNESKDDTSTMGPVLERLLGEARELLPGLPRGLNIKNYAGLRARSRPQDHPDYPDYSLGELGGVEDMYQLIGVESPGVTAAPALAREVAAWAAERTGAKDRADFDPRGRPVVRFHKLPLEKRRELLAEDPDYGHVICRCEHITRAEVLQALDNPLGVRTMAGIKYRCRAQMGRCQAGFCTPRLVEILEETNGFGPADFRLRNRGSEMFVSRTKEPLIARDAAGGDRRGGHPMGGRGGPGKGGKKGGSEGAAGRGGREGAGRVVTKGAEGVEVKVDGPDAGGDGR